ncbi:hypothetical protein Anas_11880, partial [Armadillidium nasatum]
SVKLKFIPALIEVRRNIGLSREYLFLEIFDNPYVVVKFSTQKFILQIIFSFILGGFLLFVGYLVGTTTMLPRIVNEGSNTTYSSEDLKFLASIPLLIKIPATPASVYFTEKFGPSFILRWCFVGGFLCYIAMAFFRMLTVLWIGRII